MALEIVTSIISVSTIETNKSISKKCVIFVMFYILNVLFNFLTKSSGIRTFDLTVTLY